MIINIKSNSLLKKSIVISGMNILVIKNFIYSKVGEKIF